MNIMHSIKPYLFACLALAVLLSGCGRSGMAFTPQQAVVSSIMERTQPGSIVDQSSVQVRQSQELSGHTFVMISYNQTIENRNESCLMMYEVRRSSLGTWVPGSGGGGCQGRIGGGDPAPEQAVEIGSGQSGSSGPDDPGFSNVNGLVHQEGIVKIRITWHDGSTQEVDVINGSYLALRAGEYQMTKVEGLSQDGDVLFTYSNEIAPGKH